MKGMVGALLALLAVAAAAVVAATAPFAGMWDTKSQQAQAAGAASGPLPPRDGLDLYSRAKAHADAGDDGMARALSRLGEFLASTGASVASLGDAKDVSGIATNGGVDTRFEGFAPFYVKVYVADRFREPGGLAHYLEARRKELASGSHTPDRVGQLAITFNQPTTLERLWELKERHGLVFEQVMLDVFCKGKWASKASMGIRDDSPPTELNGSLEAFRAWLGTMPFGVVPSGSSPSAGPGLALPPTGRSFEAHLIVARGRVAAARALQGEPDVLLVDPLFTFVDAHRLQAAIVSLGNVPNPYMQFRGEHAGPGQKHPLVKSADSRASCS